MKLARHWCFLAEIVEVSPFPLMPLMLLVRDKDGEGCIVSFMDKHYGAEFAHACSPGKTIAILRPMLSMLLLGAEGIWVNDEDTPTRNVRILPYRLPTLLFANDVKFGTMRKENACGRCGEAAGELLGCDACGMRYCGKVGCCVVHYRGERANIEGMLVGLDVSNHGLDERAQVLL